jgi:predicted DNA-binding protein (MmcQ/YjbR family)
MTVRKTRSAEALSRAAQEVYAYALSLPGAWEDHPWGENVAKVGKKVFLFSGWHDDESWGISVKLQESHAAAMSLPFCAATGYGLGKAGWVSARFAPGEKPLVELLKSWVRESYAHIAPKKLLAQLDGAPAKPPKTKKAATKPARKRLA